MAMTSPELRACHHSTISDRLMLVCVTPTCVVQVEVVQHLVAHGPHVIPVAGGDPRELPGDLHMTRANEYR